MDAHSHEEEAEYEVGVKDESHNDRSKLLWVIRSIDSTIVE
jgi:hypothetical protein